MLYRIAAFQENTAHAQDAWFVRNLPDGICFGVLDGVSGCRHGGLASKTAADLLADYCERMPIDEALFKAHEELLDRFKGQGLTTAVIGVVRGRTLTIASVGDSLALLCSIHTLTHIRPLLPLDKDKHQHNMITQALGSDIIKPHVHTLELPVATTLFLSTDGIGDNIEWSALARLLCSAKNVEQASDKLEQELHRRKRKNIGCVYHSFNDDDRTALILRVHQHP